MPKRKTLSRSSGSDEEIIEKTAVKRTRKARIVPKAKVDDAELKQPASDIPSDSASTSMKSKLERMLEVKEIKRDPIKKAKTKKSGYSSLYLKSLKECKRPGDPAPKKTTTKKPPKVPVDLLTQKVTEFTELADQSPDVIKLISENSLTIGAHISVAKGVYNGLINAFKIRATSMAFFITQPRRWTTEKALSDEEVSIFNEGVKILGYKRENIVPHGNYLVNLGSPDQTIYDKSYACFETELKICDQLQLSWLNIHPGSDVKGMDKEKCLQQIAESINKAHSATSNVTVLLENMCKQGTTVGGDLSDLGSIISHVTDKTRVGVCFDTCHAMAAGYDLSTLKGIEATFSELEDVVGLEYLKAFHLNDKKGHCDDHLDRHEVLGEGCIKLPVFKYLVKRFPNIPMVLETPDENKWADELVILRELFSGE